MTRARRLPGVLGALVLTAALTQSGLRAQQPDRSQPPELGPPPRLQLPPIQRETLSNGLPVLIFEKHEVPLVQIDLLVKTGSAMDPADKGGLASLTGQMLDEGAAGRGSLELADAVDFLGADLSISVDEHATMIALHTPLARLDSALAVMADVALRPDFPAAELERQRKERLTTLLQWRDEPRALGGVRPRVVRRRASVRPAGDRDGGQPGRLHRGGPEDLLSALVPAEQRRAHRRG
jgi:zinc protease